ncbi:hypothetical protein V8F20_005294 [Naviculisporaceae sp. PSN 640]
MKPGKMKSFLASRRNHPQPGISSQKEEEEQQAVQQIQGGQDLFSNLPTEIVLLIFDHLVEPGDILSVLNVCRSWRAILLSPEIWTPFADLLLPGLALHIRASSPPTVDEPCTGTAQQYEGGKAFYRALRMFHLRSAANGGRFWRVKHRVVRLLDDNSQNNSRDPPSAVSKTAVPIATSDRDDGRVHSIGQVLPALGLDLATTDGDHQGLSRIKLYSHGRLAWWPEAWHMPFFAVVDDLRSGSRKMYLFPGQLEDEGQVYDRQRRRGWKTALGKMLFVMGQEDVGVCVWHLEKDEMKRLRLPEGAFDRCVVHGERLLFVGRRNGEVWLWDWETGLVQTVDVAGMGCYAAGPVRMGGQMVLGYPPNPRPPPKVGLRLQETDEKVDFIHHPTRNNVFYVLKWDELDLVAYEITSGELTATVVCPRQSLAHRIMQLSRTEDTVHYLRSERCDAYGGYCLLTASIATDSICDPPCGCEWRVGLGSVCFNVYTKTFSALIHHAICDGTPDTHLWDGLLALTVCGGQRGTNDNLPVCGMKRVITLLEPCDGGRHSATDVISGDKFPVRTMTQSQDDFTYRGLVALVGNEIGTRVQAVCGIAYALEASGEEPGLDALKAEWLSGDERTLIYVAGKKYTVWTFGEDPRCPEEGKKEARAWRDSLRSVKASFLNMGGR